MPNLIKNVVWIERVEGMEKPRYHNVGIYMMKEDGKESIKLNTIPAGNWNGWLSIFSQRDNDEGEGF